MVLKVPMVRSKVTSFVASNSHSLLQPYKITQKYDNGKAEAQDEKNVVKQSVLEAAVNKTNMVDVKVSEK